jgi:predicted Zn-dependent protease
MRATVLIFLTTLLLMSVAQAQFYTAAPDKEAQVQKVCGGPMVTSGPQVEMLQRIVQRFATNTLFRLNKVGIAVVDVPAVNAVTFAPSGAAISQSAICMYSTLMAVMGDSEEEVAAIVAHELGHAFDRTCRQYHDSAGRILPGTKLVTVRACEARADEIGFKILVQAGYNPFAMGGAFGRLEALTGDTKTNLLARLTNTFTGSHPMTPDRIQTIHRMIADYFCRLNPATCR